jgi:hypothetical protein
MNPLVTTIRRTAPDTFTATIDGTEWQNITLVSRFYQPVMDAISAGEPVVDAPTPNPFSASAEL